MGRIGQLSLSNEVPRSVEPMFQFLKTGLIAALSRW